MTEPKHRLMQAIREAGYSKPTEAWRANQRALGISQDLMISNTNGHRKISRNAAETYAKVFGHTAGWYLYGDEAPEENGPVSLPIVGRVGASTDGAVLQETDQGPFGRIEAPFGSRGTEVAVDVKGHSMGLYAPDGSLIIYNDRHEPPHEDMLGTICVVGLPDGRILVKKLLRGSRRGLFDLESVVGEMIRDQVVEWAAEVDQVIYPKRARRLRLP